jgi:Peptidase family M23
LIIGAITPEPIPVKGSDHRFHVNYVLSILNFSARPATITKVETLERDERGPVISTMSQAEVVAFSILVGDYAASPTPVTVIPPGRTLIVDFNNVYAGAVPPTVTHRLSATFGPVPSGQNFLAGLYPDQIVQIGGLVRTSKLVPVVIAPPVAGNGWLAANGLADVALNTHLGAILPIGGRINGTERYAVDWIRMDPATTPIGNAVFKGDPTKNESDLSFGQPLHAVADGTVVSVVSDQPDIPPGELPGGLSLDQLIGNNLILELDHGVFALYGHMKENSVTVRVGQKLQQGQMIGQLGNSGNTSSPHLHFQLTRGPLPLTSDNVPWEIAHFTLTGYATTAGVGSGPNVGTPYQRTPAGQYRSNFRTTAST